MKYFIFIMLICIGCQKPIGETLISGYSMELVGQPIFLKDYNHFDYLNDEYVLDSTTVDETGFFEFKLQANKSRLVTLSDNRRIPPSFSVFQESPEIYYYSMCANFLGRDPTLYIEPSSNYNIKSWDKEGSKNSVVYASEQQNQLRRYYRTINYRDVLADEERDFLELSAIEAWQKVVALRDETLDQYKVNGEYAKDSYENYLKTEIILGSINDYLIWHVYGTDGSINNDLYAEIMDNYTEGNWNRHSLEYYKLTERYVTYQLNLSKNQTNDYYPATSEKVAFAQRFVKDNDIRPLFVENTYRHSLDYGKGNLDE